MIAKSPEQARAVARVPSPTAGAERRTARLDPVHHHPPRASRRRAASSSTSSARLARYEKLEHEVEATRGDIAAALFGPAPRVFCDLAEVDGEVAGFALWFYTFSTFVGRHGIYLEDLFVRPEFRGQGLGKALIRPSRPALRRREAAALRMVGA